MAQSKKHITPENVTEWLASTGFLFPRNEVELSRFETLFGDTDLGLTGLEIDPAKIIRGGGSPKSIQIPESIKPEDLTEYRMVARNGSKLPEHILNKIKNNQNKSKKNGDTESSD
ncbi:hypothetical protein QQY79_08390 [Flavobacterium tructae]|jgi:hypothetical protein|uniref:hypothetical protein n=1 Tax=Flavobacterium tructae TaxID=1114873 RepID=UPI002551D941|nr:hypothetical protein [Flavobacterium tructae]MDL2142534.1 hypothetical protein [Flavobacterium tructae]